jgi:hypothetical protein
MPQTKQSPNPKPKKSNEIKQKAKLPSCCSTKSGLCRRHSDNKPFDLTNRKYSKKECTTQPIKGFTMRASCAPYKGCKK